MHLDKKVSASILAVIVLIGTAAQIDTGESVRKRYDVIFDRDPFALIKEQSSSQTIPATNRPVNVPVYLTGITVGGGASKRAWLVIPQGRGQQQRRYLSLSEGDTDGDIKVLEINDKRNTVKIFNAGVHITLDFLNNNLKVPIDLDIPNAVSNAVSTHNTFPSSCTEPSDEVKGAIAALYGTQSSFTADEVDGAIAALYGTQSSVNEP